LANKANPFDKGREKENFLFRAIFHPLEARAALPKSHAVGRAHPGAAGFNIAHWRMTNAYS
jgi:hypothetical protein